MLTCGPAFFTVYTARGRMVRSFKGEYDGRFFRMERDLADGLYVWVVRQGRAEEIVKRVVLR
jgi:hypothetical protein